MDAFEAEAGKRVGARQNLQDLVIVWISGDERELSALQEIGRRNHLEATGICKRRY